MPFFFPSEAGAALHSRLQPIWEASVTQKEGVFGLHLSGRRNTEQLSVYHSSLISMMLNHSFRKHEK